jgi:hypothetical protein
MRTSGTAGHSPGVAELVEEREVSGVAHQFAEHDGADDLLLLL